MVSRLLQEIGQLRATLDLMPFHRGKDFLHCLAKRLDSGQVDGAGRSFQAVHLPENGLQDFRLLQCCLRFFQIGQSGGDLSQMLLRFDPEDAKEVFQKCGVFVDHGNLRFRYDYY